jgi:hypothetical protein
MQIPLETLKQLEAEDSERIQLLVLGLQGDGSMSFLDIPNLFEEVVTVILITIYRILENVFECSAACDPSYFYLGTEDIRTGPPTKGCLLPFK